MTKFCLKYCYGVQNWYRESRVVEAHRTRLEATKEKSFATLVIEELRGQKIVRIHTVGDFYSVEYIAKWREIIRASPKTVFYSYTRSWRVPELRTALEAMVSDCPNLFLRASVDFTHQDRPPGWPTFSVVDMEGKRCPHDLGKVAYCRDCRICFNSYTNIYVKVRWAKLWTNFSEELL